MQLIRAGNSQTNNVCINFLEINIMRAGVSYLNNNKSAASSLILNEFFS